ncbi:MAG: glycosyltransferase [Cyanobacteria bacterium J06623_7]
MPLISVIIPAYNAARTIGQTIESVKQQSWTDWELIIIDDGSQDRTLDIVAAINDSRIRAYSYDNGGVAIARNRGIKLAQGEYISFLDADDWWTKDKLARQLQALQQVPQAGVAYSWSYFYQESSDQYFPSQPVEHQGLLQSQLLRQNFLHHGSNLLATRPAIDQTGWFNPSFPHCADWDYYLRLAAHWEFVVVPQHQIYYRLSRNSMTSNIDAIEQQLTMMLEQTYTKLSPQEQNIKPESFAWVYQYCTQQYLEHGTTLSAIKDASLYLIKAIKLHPGVLSQPYTQDLLKWLLKKSWNLRRS